MCFKVLGRNYVLFPNNLPSLSPIMEGLLLSKLCGYRVKTVFQALFKVISAPFSQVLKDRNSCPSVTFLIFLFLILVLKAFMVLSYLSP